MAIPDYQSAMLPLLKFASDEAEHPFSEAVTSLAIEFKLSEDEKKELLPSGQQEIYINRIGWARTYLKKAGLIDSPRRGFLKITSRGKEVLASNPKVIDNNFLRQYDEFVAFELKGKNKEDTILVGDITQKIKKQIDKDDVKTPEEIFENAYENLRTELASTILENLKNCDPSLFEKIVIEVLVSMGYGGSLKDAGRAVGKSGDGGIDGIINEDRLGLDSIYIQAKRWQSTVGRPEIQNFAGALHGRHAKKGIFFTTSQFSKEARDYVSNIDLKIILVDGVQLADYMIEFNVGVTKTVAFELKKIDLDYFLTE